MSLYDLLKPQLTGQKPEPAPAQLGQTEAIQKLMQAKSGKAVSSVGPKQSALGEAVAAGQAKQAQAQIADQGFMNKEQQAQQALDQQQQQKQQIQELNLRKQEQQQNFNQKMDSVLNEYATGQKELKTSQDMQTLEQVGFGIRLGTEQYINKLEEVGSRKRLDDKANFELELAKSIMADNQAFVLSDLAFKNMMNMSDREFEKQMAEISIDDAINDINNRYSQMNAERIGAGVSQASSALVKGFEKWSPTTETTETEEVV